MATWDSRTMRWKGAPSGLVGAEALHVDFAARGKRFVIYTDAEVDYAFPAAACAGLGGASTADLQDVQVLPGGNAIAWPRLGLQLAMADVARGELVARPVPRPPAARRGKRTPASPPAPAQRITVLHGTWLPDNGGAFYLWAEGGPLPADVPPAREARIHLVLPGADGAPLPSPEAARWLDTVPPETAELAAWPIGARRLAAPLRDLPALGYAALQRPEELQLGADLAFWLHVFQAIKAAIARDQYIPALSLAARPGGKQGAPAFDVHPGWSFLSADLEAALRRYARAMPMACRGGSLTSPPHPRLHDAEALLLQCAAATLQHQVADLALPRTFLDRVAGTLVEAALTARPAPVELETYQAWRGWRDRLASVHTAPAFDLAFRLEAPAVEGGPWHLAFVAVSRVDPSLQLPLADHWAMGARRRASYAKAFGAGFDRQALLLLGQAARMVPLLWRGLETDRPAGLALALEEAYAFLKADAWLLEDAGFKVQVPAWWTPDGRKRLRARMVPNAPAKEATPAASKGAFGLDGLLAFRYQLSLGGEPLNDAEWAELVAAKTPLVRFRGTWIELDPAQMARVRALVEESHDQPLTLAPLELVRVAAEQAEGDVELGEALATIAERLANPRALTPVAPPGGLKATLRPYQLRGLAWLAFLDELGLNGCLADDMGLGKTVQVIARLLHEREQAPDAGPTLLIAPTSVVGNWEKELARFAPDLRVLVHHGAARKGDAAAFAAHDVVISSYALVRLDQELFAGLGWQRVVLDEAQNIKNPAAAQTRAIRKLRATHRLALTGTPVENRLLDLWSLFDFLNPGYLGKEAHFRKAFETPIQRDRDPERAQLLQRLTGPLILRRVKTDPAIIQDLPEKVEQKLYCPLTPEQASLYEAVVREAEQAVDAADGIQRKGVVLATLMKLKQVCNHPAQLLQDGSAFDPARSHKLARLTDHAREVVAGGESLLVFTQFAELGGRLEHHLRQALDVEVFFLHGATSRQARERMIGRFQDPDTGPAVFVLSLKAGGVGITLTKANHVFHFDRWWNPAVEEQATDRAFRIGQRRNVFVHKFVTLGTLEERIDAMLEDKRRLAASAVGSDESWLAGLDNEAFKALIALDRAAVRS